MGRVFLQVWTVRFFKSFDLGRRVNNLSCHIFSKKIFHILLSWFICLSKELFESDTESSRQCGLSTGCIRLTQKYLHDTSDPVSWGPTLSYTPTRTLATTTGRKQMPKRLQETPSQPLVEPSHHHPPCVTPTGGR